MRRPSLFATTAALALSIAGLALAQAPKPPAAAAPAAPAAARPVPAPGQASAPAADPVVARVGTDEIHASELSDAAKALPEELRGMPPTALYPMLLDQLIDRHVVVLAAKKEGLDRDPSVQRMVARATDSALQNALLTREIAPTLTEDAIKARYERDFAGKPGETEVHARHILVADEETAKKVIAELNGGADFAELAKKYSTDPGAQSGGDLGFFKKGDMLPEFSEVAFALKAGQTTQTPVKTRFGWHVIQVQEVRNAPPPSLEQVHDEIRQTLIQEGVSRVLAQAKTGLPIEKFNVDGSPVTPAVGALPSPAPTTPAPTPAK